MIASLISQRPFNCSWWPVLLGAVCALVVAGLATPAAAQLPVFPGAQGAGVQTPGGRGGEVIQVTNLNDSGPGSLRAAIEARGPRIVIFRVGGVIELKSDLRIRNPYITIAGQTAPGGGILLNDKVGPTETTGVITIDTHDVVLRFLKIRSGLGERGKYDAISIQGGARRVVIDHCSLSWANDEALGIWSNDGAIEDVTVSWTVLAEGLDHHSTAFLVGSRDAPEKVRRIVLHHNFFISNSHRNPWLKNASGRVVNNLIYNWRNFGFIFSDGITVDAIGNHFKAGPEIRDHSQHAMLHSISTDALNTPGVPGEPSIFIEGNRDHLHTNPDEDNWSMLDVGRNFNATGESVDRSARRDTPLEFSAFPVQPRPVAEVEPAVLDDVGASRRLDEHGQWVTTRDSVDARLVREYLDGEGRIPESEREVGGLPDIGPGVPYADSDADGMPDVWEEAHNFDATRAEDSQDADGDGYTNLEEFLNGSDPHVVDTGEDRPSDPQPAETRFSSDPIFGDRDSYREHDASRWRVVRDGEELRYVLATTNYSSPAQGILGEYAVVPGQTFEEVIVSARVASLDDFETNGGADYVLLLNFQDARNTYYAMFNRSAGSSGIYRVVDGVREELAAVEESVLQDNEFHAVSFARRGQTLEMSMDGVVVAEAVDPAPLGAGLVGLGSFNDSAAFDDVVVDSPAGTDPDADVGVDAGFDADASSGDAGLDSANDEVRPGTQSSAGNSGCSQSYASNRPSREFGWALFVAGWLALRGRRRHS